MLTPNTIAIVWMNRYPIIDWVNWKDAQSSINSNRDLMKLNKCVCLLTYHPTWVQTKLRPTASAQNNGCQTRHITPHRAKRKCCQGYDLKWTGAPSFFVPYLPKTFATEIRIKTVQAELCIERWDQFRFKGRDLRRLLKRDEIEEENDVIRTHQRTVNVRKQDQLQPYLSSIF